MGESVIAFIALGSNLGDRLGTMRRAVAMLAKTDGIFVNLAADVASLYETRPVGGPVGQAEYLNSALRVRTTLEPLALMEVLLEIEGALGRTRRERWESRVIDLDLLLFGQVLVGNSKLTLPHPRLHERRFVLEPLAEIAGDFVHPKLGRTIAELSAKLRASSNGDEVVRFDGPEWAIG